VIKVRAQACGLSADDYVRDILERNLRDGSTAEAGSSPLESGYGMWAKYGFSLSEEDIDENRAEMFSNFGEGF
jgi:hypothetical protein